MKGTDNRRLSLVEHLQDLRRAIMMSLAAFGLAAAGGYFLAPYLFLALKKPLPTVTMVFLGPMDALYMQLRLAVLAGLVLAFPVILYSVAWFIGPGMTAKEKNLTSICGALSLILFIAGVAYAYFVVLPALTAFLFTFSTPQTMPFVSGEEYLSFALGVIVNCGLIFQIPLVLFLALSTNLLNPRLIAGKRWAVLLALTGLTLFLTPGGDMLTQALLALPVYLLLEAAVFVAGIAKRYCVNIRR